MGNQAQRVAIRGVRIWMLNQGIEHSRDAQGARYLFASDGRERHARSKLGQQHMARAHQISACTDPASAK